MTLTQKILNNQLGNPNTYKKVHKKHLKKWLLLKILIII